MTSSSTNHTSIKSYSLYVKDVTDNSNDFANYEVPFEDGNPFTSWGVILKNDNAAPGAAIQFSFNGTDNHGELAAQEAITFDGKRATQIFIRSTAISNFRLFVW